MSFNPKLLYLRIDNLPYSLFVFSSIITTMFRLVVCGLISLRLLDCASWLKQYTLENVVQAYNNKKLIVIWKTWIFESTWLLLFVNFKGHIQSIVHMCRRGRPCIKTCSSNLASWYIESPLSANQNSVKYFDILQFSHFKGHGIWDLYWFLMSYWQ